SLALLWLGRGAVLWQFPGIRDKLWITWDVWSELLWHLDTILSLVILKDTANSSLGSAESRVQAVHVLLGNLLSGCGTKTDFKVAGLVVQAVRARHKFLVLTLVWDPGPEIVLFG